MLSGHRCVGTSKLSRFEMVGIGACSYVRKAASLCCYLAAGCLMLFAIDPSEHFS